jgi:hypothetical protein
VIRKTKKKLPRVSERVVSGEVRSDNVNLRKRTEPRWRTAKRKTLKDLARYEFPGLGFLGQGQSGVRSCSLVGSLGMTPAQQGGEINPLKRRVDDPREGSLYPPRRSVGIPLGRFPSRFGPSPRVRQHLLHTENTP